MTDQATQPTVGQQSAQPPKQTGLFGNQKPAAPSNPLNDVVLQLNDVSRRLIILEERYMNLRKKTQLTDQNMLENNKATNKQVADAKDSMTLFRRDISDVREKLKSIAGELTTCAKQQEVQVLSKYIDMWNPAGFVTRNEIYKLIKEQVESTMMDLNLKIQQEEYIKQQIEEMTKKLLKNQPKTI